MKIIFLEKTLSSLSKESSSGNIEYKRKILKINEKILDKRATQMLYRSIEGDGKAYYYVGVDDDGSTQGISSHELIITLENLEKISKLVGLNIQKATIYKGKKYGNYIAILEIYKKHSTIIDTYSFI